VRNDSELLVSLGGDHAAAMAELRTANDPSGLAGLWVPVVTPFRGDGTVDAEALERLCERLLADGVDGLVALGTTGEPATLEPAERRAVIEIVAAVTGRHGRRLMVGAGTNDAVTTHRQVEAVLAVARPDAVLLTVPYYTRPSEAAIGEHVRSVAARHPVPLVVYNVPYRTGRGLSAATLAGLALVPGVSGVKQAVGALDLDSLELLRRAPASFGVLCGDDAFIAPLVLLGGAGAIAAAAHVATRHFVALVAAARDGQIERTRRLAAALLPVVEAGFAEPNPAVWKGALHAVGELPTAALRRPMTEASAAAVQRVIDALGPLDALDAADPGPAGTVQMPARSSWL
jgi:4-hydroxy-tetrahydrodipicolinate synthase